MKRALTWILLVSSPLLVLLVWHGIETSRGKANWDSWERSRQAKGEHLNWDNLAPHPVPEDQNFAAAPLVKAAIDGDKDHPLLGGFDLKSPETVGDWKVGRPDDLEAWATANGSRNMPAMLTPVDPYLDALVEVSRISGSRMDIRPQDFEIPPLLGFRSATRLLRLRAESRMGTGQNDDACEDALAILRISDHFKAEPSLIVYLLRVATVSVGLQPLWQGLNSHQWNEEQLRAIQAQLAKVDLLQSYRIAFQAERLSQRQLMNFHLESTPWHETYSPIPDQNRVRRPYREKLSFWIRIPKGAIYENMINADQYIVETCIDPIDPDLHRVDSRVIDTWIDWPEKTPTTRNTFLAKIQVPELAKQSERMALTQTGADEAFIACALERYRLAHKIYPDSLDALVPAYAAKLPNDLFSGQPLRYRREGDGFSLYSVGWNGTDEGGVMAMDGKDRDLAKGDWPWPQAAR